MHSTYAQTEHRGTIITALHGLPVTFTPCQDAMNQPPACPDWHDHREHIEGTMPTRPGEVHRVYAAGQVAKTFPKVMHLGNDLGLQAANIYAKQLRERATDASDRAEITVDPWCPVESFSDAHTTRIEFDPMPTIWQEAEAAGFELVGLDD